MAGKAKGGVPPKTPSMTMFGDWMVEKASPTCVPRLCTLQISRLVIQRTLDAELQTVYIAVKMDGSRHSLRTSEIVLANGGTQSQSHELEMDLEVCFSLQYSHSLKRDNQLQVLLQRKKRLRYKNSRLPGYKTVACASINMTSVLQRALDARELDLLAVPVTIAKNGHLDPPVAQLTVSCSSQPLLDRFAAQETILAPKRTADAKLPARRSADEASDAELSADADGAQLSGDADMDAASDRDRLDEIEHESADEMPMDALAQAKTLKYIMELPATVSAHEHRRRQNLKQRLRSQLQKMMRGMMRPGDDDDVRPARGKKQKKLSSAKQRIDDELLEAAFEAAQTQDPEEQNRLFDELSELNLSAADSEVSDDAESVRSTAKPTLRPFFSSKAISEDTLHHGSMQSLSNVRIAHASGPGAALPLTHTMQTMLSSSQKRYQAPPLASANTMNVNVSTGSNPCEPLRECFTPPVLTAPPTTPAFSYEQAKRALAEQLNRLFGDEGKQPHTCMSVQHGLPGAAQPAHACGGLPDPLAFVSAASVGSSGAQLLTDRLVALGVRAVVTPTHAETRTAFSFLATRIAKYCDVHSHAPPLIRVALVGGDAHVNGALRSFVEHFAAKPPTWLRYVLFFIVPFVGSHGLPQTNVARYLCAVDRSFASYFTEPIWRNDDTTVSSTGTAASVSDSQLATADAAARRIRDYLNTANGVLNLAIGEVQITAATTSKQSRTEDDSVFVPFLSDVRVGIDSLHAAGESADELPNTSSSAAQTSQTPALAAPNTSQPIGILSDKAPLPTSGLSQSPPSAPAVSSLTGTVTPPSSPAAPSLSKPLTSTPQPTTTDSNECVELQIDTWLLPGRSRPDDKESERDSRDERSSTRDDRESSKKDKEKEKEERKDKEKRKADAAKQNCLKGLFRTVCANRVPSLAQLHTVCLALSGLPAASSNPSQLVHAAAPTLLGSAGLLSCSAGLSSSNGSASPASLILGSQTCVASAQQLNELFSTFTLTYTTREKKQKMTMRIGKKPNKDKDDSARSQLLDGVTRLVCSAPARGDKSTPLTVFVDGVEYSAVKFFQLSSHWQSHVKHFPVACFITPPTFASSSVPAALTVGNASSL